jgi:hypothetical protein
MTEEEWLTCREPYGMLEYLKTGYSNRRTRLFACACSRRVWEFIPRPAFREAVEMAEEYADGRIALKECKSAHKRLRIMYRSGEIPSERSRHASYAASECLNKDVGWHPSSRYSAINAICASTNADSQHTKATEAAAQSALLRDIFGNPFRPVAFDPRWRTDTAVGLAQTMYDTRDFDAMPILADALQDAGCEDAAILDHCRDANGVHVRGCWVVDRVLGKT